MQQLTVTFLPVPPNPAPQTLHHELVGSRLDGQHGNMVVGRELHKITLNAVPVRACIGASMRCAAGAAGSMEKQCSIAEIKVPVLVCTCVKACLQRTARAAGWGSRQYGKRRSIRRASSREVAVLELELELHQTSSVYPASLNLESWLGSVRNHC